MADPPTFLSDSVEELPDEKDWKDSIYGIGVALCFAGSAIFVRRGLEGLPSPLLGLTMGMIVAVFAYSSSVFLQAKSNPVTGIPASLMGLEILAGVFIGLGTWARYIAMDLTEVAVVIALGRLNVPMVLLLSPLVIGREHERVTARVWLGAALIIIGALLLIFRN